MGEYYAKRIAVWVAVCMLAVTALGVTISPVKEGGWTIEGKTYAAKVDASGGLVSLKSNGVEMLGTDAKKVTGAPFPGAKPATSVNLRGDLIAARNDTARVEYSFDDTGVGIETEGAAWTCGVTSEVSAFLSTDGSVRPGTVGGVGNLKRMIVGTTGMEFSEPFHCMGRRLVPSAIPSGRKKPEDPYKFRFELGVSADATVLIEVKDFAATGKDPKVAPWYKEGEKASYSIEMTNLGAKDREVVLAYKLGTHYGSGGKLAAETALPAVKVPAGKGAKSSFEVAAPGPGIHWVNLELRVDGKAVQREQRAFVYAGEKYRPELTRPKDFREFWDKQLATLRAEDMKAQLKEVPEKSTPEAGFYTLGLTIKGNRYEMPLTAPKKPGKYMAIFGGKMGPTATETDNVVVSMSHAQWPDQATYTRWVSESDNNLLDCYLVAVRITDYLRSRPDVERIYLSGGSRQGAIQLVNAAIDPTKICATEPHVPTCVGISSTEYPYRGWGKVPTPPAMAAYVDPLNFAPDMTVPFIMDLGAYDGLSPAPGGLAFFNHARSSFKRFSVELGGHGYFTSGFKKQAKAELAALLKEKASAGIDEKVMKEH